MGISLSPHSSKSYAQIQLEVDSGANLSVDDPPRSVSIALAIDWTFLLVHRFGDDKPWIRSGLFPSSGIAPS